MWRRIAVSPELPVLFSEVKSHCRSRDIEDDEDPLLNGYLAAAHEVAAERLGYPVVAETWRATFIGTGRVAIPLYPVTKLVSVSLADAPLQGFSLDLDGDAAWIVGPWSNEPVEVSVTVGGDPPLAVRQAIKLLTAYWFGPGRDAAGDKPMSEIPLGVNELIGLHRRGWVGA